MSEKINLSTDLSKFAELSKRILNVFAKNGVTTFGEAYKVPVEDFKHFMNVGKSSVNEFIKWKDKYSSVYDELTQRKQCEINWEQRRYEIAKDCCAVLMTCENLELHVSAEISVKQADALIAELKKGGSNYESSRE